MIFNVHCCLFSIDYFLLLLFYRLSSVLRKFSDEKNHSYDLKNSISSSIMSTEFNIVFISKLCIFVLCCIILSQFNAFRNYLLPVIFSLSLANYLTLSLTLSSFLSHQSFPLLLPPPPLRLK